MGVKNCPLGPDYDGIDCEPDNCVQCQLDEAADRRPVDELPNYDYYGVMPPY